MKIVLFSVAGSPPIVGNITDENEGTYVVEYPVVFLKDDPYVYTMPYMPFAKNGLVSFNRSSIITISDVNDDIESHYKEVVTEIKNQKISFKKNEQASSDQQEIKMPVSSSKQKTFH